MRLGMPCCIPLARAELPPGSAPDPPHTCPPLFPPRTPSARARARAPPPPPQVRVLQCVSSTVELLGDRLRPHLPTICSALPQVLHCGVGQGGGVGGTGGGREDMLAAHMNTEYICAKASRKLVGENCLTARTLCPPPPPTCRQVWQVISQRRQEGAGGLARLHSALISTGVRGGDVGLAWVGGCC